eukprot:2106840-Amphidinium_carterae.1
MPLNHRLHLMMPCHVVKLWRTHWEYRYQLQTLGVPFGQSSITGGELALEIPMIRLLCGCRMGLP